MHPTDNTRGFALVVMLLTMVLLAAVGAALVLATTAETRIAANFLRAQQTLYATDAAVARATVELMATPDWNALIGGGVVASFADGPARGERAVADGWLSSLVE